MLPYLDMIDRINERCKGELIIECLGGPEVIPSMQQPEAVRKGVVDMCVILPTMYPGLNPAFNLISDAELGAVEQRESGAYDFINELHKEVGLYYLGMESYYLGGSGYLLCRDPLETPRDLAGRTLGPGDDAQEPFWTEVLGMTGVQMPTGEAYSAVERGVLDVIVWPLSHAVDVGIPEVCPYIIDHGTLNLMNCSSLMNLDRFNSLPKHLQDLLIEESIQVEIDGLAYSKGITAAARQKALDAGAEFIKFSPADAEWFVQTHIKMRREADLARAGEDGPKLWELLMTK